MALKGKTILVTGASSRASANPSRVRFAAEGCNIILNGFEQPSSDRKATRRVRKAALKIIYHPADVGKPDEVEAMMASALKRFGTIDILINNAVTQHYAPVEASGGQMGPRLRGEDLSAAFHTIRLALPAK